MEEILTEGEFGRLKGTFGFGYSYPVTITGGGTVGEGIL